MMPLEGDNSPDAADLGFQFRGLRWLQSPQVADAVGRRPRRDLLQNRQLVWRRRDDQLSALPNGNTVVGAKPVQ